MAEKLGKAETINNEEGKIFNDAKDVLRDEDEYILKEQMHDLKGVIFMNAIQLILNQHARIRKLLSQLTKSKTSSSLKKNFEKLSAFLISHETMEQKFWYPFLKKNTKLKTTITALIHEEKTAAKTIAKIKKIKSEEKFEEKIMELKLAVAHHAKEEETKLLPKAKKLIEEADLKKIGKDMSDFKKEFDKK